MCQEPRGAILAHIPPQDHLLCPVKIDHNERIDSVVEILVDIERQYPSAKIQVATRQHRNAGLLRFNFGNEFVDLGQSRFSTEPVLRVGMAVVLQRRPGPDQVRQR